MSKSASLDIDPSVFKRLSQLDSHLGKFIRQRKHAEALVWLERAQAAMPRETRLEPRLVRVALAAGESAKAESAAQRARAAKVADSWCHFALATAARRRGELESAMNFIDEGLRQSCTSAVLHGENGEILQALGRREQAALAFEAAANLAPEQWQFLHKLAVLSVELGDKARAKAIHQQMILRAADTYEAQFALGNRLQTMQLLEQAQLAYARASEHAPKRIDALINRGAVLRQLGRLGAALELYDHALTLEPTQPSVRYNRGNLLKSLGQLDAALEDYEQALAITPDNGTLHWNKAITLLTQGKLPEGFREYEWRWKHAEFPTRRRHFNQPVWNGETLHGRTLFVHAEQGQGDLIQFLRFLPMLRERGGRVIVEVHPELKALIAAQGLSDEVTASGEKPPTFDLYVALGSLPHILGVTLHTLPRPPYLKVPASVPRLLSGPRKGLRVGLVWAGNPDFIHDRERSMQFAQLQPLMEIPGIEWFSLQKGYAGAQIPLHAPLRALGESLTDWSTTAQTIADLDLLISTCTGPAHLGGAMGRPVWVLLAHDADWRWLRNRSDSPWYPSLRLFRQPTPGDWRSVVTIVGVALRALRDISAPR